MMFSTDEIRQHAAMLGFRADSLEKVCRLLSLLEALRSHPFLRPRVALKGGTALNLFLFDVPRLSVDIDLNYVGSGERQVMLDEKPKIDQAIQAVCSREGLAIKRMPTEHAGGKWRLSFTNASGAPDKLEVDLNFMLRVPLWPVMMVDSRSFGRWSARQIAVLDRHELAAGKLAALCSRRASRDLFDAVELLRRADLDRTKLRLAFVVYGGMNRKDWRTLRVEDIDAAPTDFERELVPMLRADLAPPRAEIPKWTERLVRDCRELMAALLPLRSSEIAFLDHLNDQGEIVPELLTDDMGLQAIIRDHPGLQWKALKAKRRAGQAGQDEP